MQEEYNYTYDDFNWNDDEFWYNINNKNHRYYPDIPFYKKNLIIEVKSDYTYSKNLFINIHKSKSVIEKGYNFAFWIIDRYNNLLIISDDDIKLKQKLNEEIINYKVL